MTLFMKESVEIWVSSIENPGISMFFQAERIPGYFKIVYTTDAVVDRLRLLILDYNREMKVLFHAPPESTKSVPNAWRVEQLCHAELPVFAPGKHMCNTSHWPMRVFPFLRVWLAVIAPRGFLTICLVTLWSRAPDNLGTLEAYWASDNPIAMSHVHAGLVFCSWSTHLHRCSREKQVGILLSGSHCAPVVYPTIRSVCRSCNIIETNEYFEHYCTGKTRA